MSAAAVREYHGKRLLAKHITSLSPDHTIESRSALVTPTTDLDGLPQAEPWILESDTKLVVKPDQLIKRRGKAGLVGIDLSYDQVKEWISERMNKEIRVEKVSGKLDHFIIEPFVAHTGKDEHYVCIQSNRTGDEILFCVDGGVDVGDVDAKAKRIQVDIDAELTLEDVTKSDLLEGIENFARKVKLSGFMVALFKVYRKLHFTYLEINPIVFASDGSIVPLDLAAKIDSTSCLIVAVVKKYHFDCFFIIIIPSSWRLNISSVNYLDVVRSMFCPNS